MACTTIWKIDAEKAKKWIEEEKAVLLDVREQEEYQKGHIHKSICIPLIQLSDETGKLMLDKEDSIIVCCQSGNRSRQGAEVLKLLGYENVYDLGGIENWPFELITETI